MESDDAESLVTSAIKGCARRTDRACAGDIRAISVDVTNTGVPAALVLDVHLEGGAIVSAPGATATADASATWTLDLGRDETTTVTLLVRNGEGAALVVRSRLITVRRGHDLVLGEHSTSVSVSSTEIVMARAQAELIALSPTSRAEQQVVSRTLRTLAGISKDETSSAGLESIVRDLVLAGQDLEALGSASESAHLAVGELMRCYETKLYRVLEVEGETTP